MMGSQSIAGVENPYSVVISVTDIGAKVKPVKTPCMNNEKPRPAGFDCSGHKLFNII